MTNHFSSIGFHLNSAEELVDLANKAGPQSEAIEVKDGFYYYWHDQSGAELWIQANRDNELIGMNPHFAGQSMVKIVLTNAIDHPDHTALDGTLQGWANSSAYEKPPGDFSFDFDLPNFAEYEKLNYPSTVGV